VTARHITDCERELGRIGAALAEPERTGGANAAAERAQLLLRHARLSGIPDELRAADAAIDTALRRYPGWPDLSFLRASADLDLHRPGKVLQHLNDAAGLAGSPTGLELRGAALEQAGSHAAARQCFTRALAADPSWQALAGLAQLRSAAGDAEGADELYAQAEDELTAKQMSAFAWVRVARGSLAAKAGRWDTAWAHYRTADAAFTGFWLVGSRIAGLLYSQGLLDEAESRYCDLRARTARPELAQALGDVHRGRGDAAEAAAWYAVALAEYRDSAGRGEALYLHHLATYYADVAGDHAEAARWAALDQTARHDPGRLAGRPLRPGPPEEAAPQARQMYQHPGRDRPHLGGHDPQHPLEPPGDRAGVPQRGDREQHCLLEGLPVQR
jgi:tetratricopeptide (TPR) repeat protein